METAENDPRILYADIYHLPHHQSAAHPRMSLYARAAQFSSYDALSGFFDMIAEEERSTEAAADLDENAREMLNEKLLLIAEDLESGRRPRVCFTVFVPDQRKEGGSYEQITARVKRIDPVARCVILTDRSELSGTNRRIEFDRITAIRSEATDRVDERC